jgi:hypothetical protein
MANKFQKSVLDRLEAEEKRRKSTATSETAPQEAENADAKASTPIPAEREAATTAPGISDIRDYLIHDARRVAKNKTFYLDIAVADEIKRISREQQVTESRLVNDVLRGVFGV